MRPASLIGTTVLCALASLTAQAATALPARAADATPPLPIAIAAIGNSITTAWGSGTAPAGGNLAGDNLAASWATGTSAVVDSHLLRLRRLGAAPAAVNLGRAGRKVTDADGIVGQAATVPAGTTYVLVEAGSADLCADDVTTAAALAPAATFQARVEAALTTLTTNLPGVHVLVASIPDWAAMAQALPGLARPAGTCPLLFGATPDAAALRAQAGLYDAALAAACAAFPACRYDGGAAHAVALTGADISSVDHFHLTISGQAKLAAATWPAGWYAAQATGAPPVVTVPAGIALEATQAGGARATYAVSATDPDDTVASLGCLPVSGSLFPVGTTTVSCTAADTHGNSATASFPVTVADTTAPALAVPAAAVAEAASPAGATVEFAAAATDLVDGALQPSCAPATSSLFAIGTTVVACSATDAHGNAARRSFPVTVRDTTPPAFQPPFDVAREATGPDGATVPYGAVQAVDAVDGARSVHCSPVSGWRYPLGSTVVSCAAADTRGNSATRTFRVVVADTTPPEVTVPADLVVDVSGQGTAPVVTVPAGGYAATDLVDGALPVTCSPGIGSRLASGTTAVQCGATDRAGNRGSRTFFVTVIGAAPAPAPTPSGATPTPAPSGAPPSSGGGGAAPDLRLTGTVDRQGALAAGDTATVAFALAAAAGWGGATGLHLLVTLPAGVELAGAPLFERGSGCSGTRELDCFLDFLSAGMTTRVQLPLRVAGATPGARLTVAARTSQVEADGAPADNQAAVTLAIASATAAAPPARAGAPLALAASSAGRANRGATLRVRVRLSVAASVRIVVRGPRGGVVKTLAKRLPAGQTIVSLGLSTAARRLTERLTVQVTATAGARAVTRTLAG